MRVCLINPPSGFLLDDRVFPPLGILRVAASLEQQGIEVEVVDLSGRAGIKIPPATHYGVSATSPQMPAAVRLLPLLEGRVILGGPHATMVSAAAKRGSARAGIALGNILSLFPTVVAGDGESAILPSLSTTGLIDADDPHSPYCVSSQDSLPPPARHLIDLSSYHYSIDGSPATSVVSQLGCPFGCAFCGGRFSSFYRRVRLRSVPSILSEISSLHQNHGYTGFMFLDDELNVAPQMLEMMRALLQYQRDHGVSFSLRGFIKASLFTPAQADTMVAAGFREVLMGFESGSDRILRNIQKGSVSDNDRALEVARHAGLRVKALMSIGHPGETHDTITDTRSWILSRAPEDFDITIITPYPGTPYWDEATHLGSYYTYVSPKTGDRLHMEDIDYLVDPSFYKGIPGQYRSLVHTDHLSPSDLVEARDHIEASVRNTLSIPWPSSSSHFDHSMGQSA